MRILEKSARVFSRVVLAGHVHVFHRSGLFPGVPQICAPRTFDGEALELDFLP